jgi:hypothetical protein
LVDLLVRHREKLRRLNPDTEQTRTLRSTQQVRKAFFHGLLTGYAVALKLW